VINHQGSVVAEGGVVFIIWRRMGMKLLSIVLLFVLAPPGWGVDVAKNVAASNITSRVAAKGDGFLVQSIQFPLGDPLRRDALFPNMRVEQVLLHTRLPGGKGTELLHTRTNREWRTRTGSFSPSRIVGVAHDAQCLYVAVWHANGRGTYPAFLLPLEQRPKVRRRYNTRLEVHVFALADGRRLHHAAAAGPLKLMDGGVDCFGTAAALQGWQARDERRQAVTGVFTLLYRFCVNLMPSGRVYNSNQSSRAAGGVSGGFLKG